MRAVWVFLGIVVAIFGTLELTCRFVLPNVIDVEATREREYGAAVAKRDVLAPQVLVVGNSLLGEGVDFPALREQVTGPSDVRRVMVEDTTFYDWLFGIKRLLADGARPDVLALMLSPDQLLSNGLRGEYTAYRLMRTGDTLEAARRLELSNSASADLFMSSMSAFLGMRNNIRRRVLLGLVPGLKELLPHLNARGQPKFDADAAFTTAAGRLKELQALCEAAGVRFMLVIPPTDDKNFPEMTQVVEKAARQTGTHIAVPIAPGQLPSDHFADGYHLNATGAAKFTSRLSEVLTREIDKTRIGAGL